MKYMYIMIYELELKHRVMNEKTIIGTISLFLVKTPPAPSLSV